MALLLSLFALGIAIYAAFFKGRKKQPKQDDKEDDNTSIAIAALAIMFAWLVMAGFAFLAASEKRTEAFGQFGDSFGVLNALFSGVALIGAIYAVILQRKDFRLTLKEYSETREANQKTAAAQERAAEISGYTSLIEIETKRLNNIRRGQAYINDVISVVNGNFGDFGSMLDSLNQRISRHDSQLSISESLKIDLMVSKINEKYKDYILSRNNDSQKDARTNLRNLRKELNAIHSNLINRAIDSEKSLATYENILKFVLTKDDGCGI